MLRKLILGLASATALTLTAGGRGFSGSEEWSGTKRWGEGGSHRGTISPYTRC